MKANHYKKDWEKRQINMSEISRPYNEIDDYIAAFSTEERLEYIAAETDLDLACILYRIRQEQTGLKQQAISRLEKAASNMQLGTHE
ncbi:MAG: hypothetical protein M3Y81_00905 [Chloroflexota bacterium]|nr:hypothetical protein [Chloroflexota bacterium]